jgi:ABC-type lipoprotein export system ATPase subunit
MPTPPGYYDDFRIAAIKYNRCVIIVTHNTELARQAHEIYKLKECKLSAWREACAQE